MASYYFPGLMLVGVSKSAHRVRVIPQVVVIGMGGFSVGLLLFSALLVTMICMVNVLRLHWWVIIQLIKSYEYIVKINTC